MMRNAVLWVWLLIFAASAFAGRESEPIMYITCTADKNTVYEGEAVRLMFVLHSSQPRLAYANVSREAALDKGEFKQVTRIETDRRGRPADPEKGVKMYSFPLETLYVAFADKGDYQLAGGEYEVGIEYPMAYNDPFWGLTRSVKVEKKSVPVPPLKIKVKKLPVQKKDEDFSGAIGEFKISTELPPGEILVGRPAVAVIRIQGKGFLDDNILPDYSDMFGEGAVLKSMSENKSAYLRNGALVTELTLECEFVPKKKDAVLGSVRFTYFNPVTGKYETSVSEPVELHVGSGLRKLPTSDV